MTAAHDAPLREFKRVPPGMWVLCGFGRCGKAVQRHIAKEGVELGALLADAGDQTARLHV